MADTVITPASRDYDSGANAMGWAVAVILLLGVILFGIFVWPGVGRVAPAAPANTDRTIDLNVTVPEGAIPGTNSGTNNGGAAGGAQGGQQQGGTQTQ